MTASTNRELQKTLKAFKKGHRVPKGHRAVFNNGIYKEDIYSNGGRNCGQKVGVTKVYENPSYDIYKEDECIFSIENTINGVVVFGESNCESAKDWSKAFEIGLDFFKNGD